MRKAMAGSVVVPDFEMTFTQTSLPSHMDSVSARAVELMELPKK